ncbi:lysosomal cholesterol signaling protein-like isoform X2 [Watersipora subatra]|uniref:lysosomal cholesterol signaling protein-like isoform X2 n=1 Tax=Watersipora subatra TaxID=2589382 RepID=UPI00355C5A22
MSSTNETIMSLCPALVECFTIILLGFIAGRARWITPSQTEGLNIFTGWFALPAMLFTTLATLDWSTVEWLFLLSILISKASLFFIVLLVSLVLEHPMNVGAAGLYSIFATKSNDLALAVPIFSALYGKSHPEFVQYIYLIAPISVVILNPIAFVLLEIQKASAGGEQKSKGRIFLSVIKQIFTNPIIISTILGVIANFLFHGILPAIIDSLLTTLADSFNASALFLLGICAVGKFSNPSPLLLAGCGLLVTAKLLVLSIIAIAVTTALQCGADTNSTADYSMFAFIYGTIPTAPTVYIYATHYGVAVHVISTSLVLATAIAAPFMFITAIMVSIPMFSLEDSMLPTLSVDISIISITFCVGVLLLFAFTRRGCELPHIMVVLLIIFQLLANIGTLVPGTMATDDCKASANFADYFVYLLHAVGTLGISCMFSISAICIYLISCHGVSYALQQKWKLLLYGLGFPVLIGFISIPLNDILSLPCVGLRMFGFAQVCLVTVVLALNTLVAIYFLVLRHRCMSQQQSQLRLATDISSMESSLNVKLTDGHGRSYGACSKKTKVPAIEDLTRSNCSQNGGLDEERSPLLDACSRCPDRVGAQEQCVNGDSTTSPKLGRTLAFLIVQIVSQIVVLNYYIWTMVEPPYEGDSNYLVEIEFLFVVTHSGQGIFIFLIFGLDTEIVLSPIKRLFQRLCAKKSDPERQIVNLSVETVRVCSQFEEHHLQHCKETLPRVHRSRKDCFHGAALSSWLMRAGLAPSTTEAQMYAEHLLRGSIIESCSKRPSDTFIDTKSAFYRFSIIRPAEFSEIKEEAA